MSLKYNLVQISDTHLFSDKEAKINGSNSYLNLEKVLKYVSGLEEKPELLLLTGDISQDSTPASYQNVLELLNACNIKYYLLPGNHDNADVINSVFKYQWIRDKVDYFVRFKDWLLYFIDTTIYPYEEGKLEHEQIVKFQKTVTSNKDVPTIVFMHHHPVPIKSKWMDKMILKNHDDFNKVVRENSQIKAVLFGHIHQVFEEKIDNVFYGSVPATCYQLVPQNNVFAVDKLTPGFRLITLDGNEFKSKVVWA